MTIKRLQQFIQDAKQAWVFQWNPADYDTFVDFHTGKETEPWRVNAHWGRMQPGDIALLWKTAAGFGESEGEAGIYAIGVLQGVPYPAPPDDICRYRVIIEYVSLLSAPILKSTMQNSNSASLHLSPKMRTRSSMGRMPLCLRRKISIKCMRTKTESIVSDRPVSCIRV